MEQEMIVCAEEHHCIEGVISIFPAILHYVKWLVCVCRAIEGLKSLE